MSDMIERKSAIEAVLSIGKVDLSDGDAVVRMSAVNYVLRNLPSAQPETCDTCKHGYFGDTQCDNCCVRYPSHYERRTDE